MRQLSTDELRRAFLDFFESRGHKVVQSDMLVPKDDPTVLFTSAGMNQFKEQFLGKNITFKRATTCQKCLRTDDLDKVGKTSSHHTFFEMLGNFSFGDYFKEEAIAWAWEFMTKVLEVPPERLWVSVYKDDAEAYKVWLDKIKIPKDKIVQLGEKDNFWPSEAPSNGPNGPCGPCSEIFYDQGKEYGCGEPACGPSCGCGRFVEVWNLVFTQFERFGENKLTALPSRNIDTGMGLERMSAVMQGVYTNFEVDIFRPVIDEIAKQAGGSRGPALSAIADHARAVLFAICDGVLPSNEERGYVVRKLIRKASWHARQLGIEEPFLYKLIPILAKAYASPYPELLQRRENVSRIILSEEEKFAQTLVLGQAMIDELFAELESQKKKLVPGELIFKLYDTYGFPVELTSLIAKERGYELDIAGYESLMAQQKERAKQKSAILQGVVFAGSSSSELAQAQAKTEFLGYDADSCKARVTGIFKDEKPCGVIGEKEAGIVILDKSVFYAESGGQAADRGELANEDARASVLDVKYFGSAIAHYVEVNSGKLRVGDEVTASLDLQRRQDLMRNHTATHLLQRALREVLGEHVQQAGSLVDQEKLRFDFTHFAALDERALNRVEEIVNEKILRNDKVLTNEMPAQEAIKSGAMALFGEKYGQTVRVVRAGESMELCGGTHARTTGEIGLFKIISEGSVQSGVRRIEAQTGRWACKKVKEDTEMLKELAASLRCAPGETLEALERLIEKAKSLEKGITNAAAKKFEQSLDSLLSRAKDLRGVSVIVERFDGAGDDLLRRNIDLLRQRVKSGIFVFGSKVDERAIFICGVTDDLAKRAVRAGDLVNRIAAIAGGSGGGRPQLAKGGAKDAALLDEALSRAMDIIKKQLESV